jgi:hypothetical protein
MGKLGAANFSPVSYFSLLLDDLLFEKSAQEPISVNLPGRFSVSERDVQQFSSRTPL